MALAMAPAAPLREDVMDIDIDMDLDDAGPMMEEEVLEEGEEPEFVPSGVTQATASQIPAIYLEDPEEEPQWQRIHLRGVDELSTQNLEVYALDNYAEEQPRVQWIDDTSANLIYTSTTHSAAAILNLVATPITAEEIQQNPFELRPAKTMSTHPGSMLTLRIAKAKDKKIKNARHASRYYLMHPEADPEERTRRRENTAGRPRRGGEDGEYNRNRFDEQELRRRRRKHEDDKGSNNDFAASMYDDAPPEAVDGKDRGRDLFSRITKGRRRSASPTIQGRSASLSDSEDDRSRRKRNPYRSRDSPPPRKRANVGKELFSDLESNVNGGALRSDNPDNFVKKALNKPRLDTDVPRYQANAAAARQIRADMKAAQTHSPVNKHRRSRAMDTRAEEDLIERFGRKSISIDSTKSVTQPTANSGKELFGDSDSAMGGFSIKGSASQGMSIKGRAENVKELFPNRYGRDDGRGNVGKELFSDKVRTRGPRQQALDLFD